MNNKNNSSKIFDMKIKKNRFLSINNYIRKEIKNIRNDYNDSGYNLEENGDNFTRKQLPNSLIVERENEEKLKISNEYCDMIVSGILGFIIGDAMGVPLEFTDRNKKNPVRDMEGYGSHRVPEGTWSDDTSMTIATIDSIIKEQTINYQDIMNNFVSWAIDSKYTATDKVFDIGLTTNKALRKYRKYNIDPIKCGSGEIYENGNGSLMRILPIVYYLNKLNLSDDQKTQIINDSSSLTHSHEISKMGCKIYFDYIEGLINNQFDKFKAYNYIKTIDYSKYYSFETIEKYTRILEDDISKFKSDSIKSSGYVVSTLESSLWTVLTTNSYEDAIIKAINLGDDTDTIGAITGSLAGMIYRYKSFPKRWTEKLKKRDYLIDLAIKFAKTLESIDK